MVMFSASPSKAEFHCLSFPSISFSFQIYLYPCQHDYALYSPLVIMLIPLHQHNYILFSPCNYAYSIMSFLLTTIDIASLAALSLCAALYLLISIFAYISLLALKDLVPIYTGLLPWLYLNFDLYNPLCLSIFPCFEALHLWKPSCLH